MALQKSLTGIEGFDQITLGGLPQGRTTLVVGSPGAGKTVFALQTLVNGARKWGEPGIFVAFEENSRQIIENAASFGWDLPALEQQKLFFLDAHLSPDTVTAGEFDLAGMLASLRAKADEMGARRLVFDSLDVMLMLLANEPAERREMYRIRDWLAQMNMTGIITTRASESGQPLVHGPFMQYMADCVVTLSQRVADRVALRAVRIMKYRGSSFYENEFPFVIGPNGIEIGHVGIVEQDYPVFTERISTGVDRLDTMLAGGYYRGTSTLITGAPGTAKTTLSAAFVESASQRGERSLYICFDEAPNEIARNMVSVGIDLAPHVESGLLQMVSALSELKSAEEHLITIRHLMDQHQPRCLVVDPLSAMLKSGGSMPALAVAQRLLLLAKERGITSVSTSLLEGSEGDLEASSIRVSTIADTWIHLSYVARGGERNRALTIVKSRGTGHSNQVRELILTSEGLTLADVYTIGGQVLMGTERFERKQAHQQEQERAQAELERKRRDLALAEAEIRAQVEALNRELEARRAALESAEQEHQALADLREAQRRGVEERRHMDTRPPGAREGPAPSEPEAGDEDSPETQR